MAFLITTTGTQNPVTFSDLGGRTFAHPTVDYDLSLEYSLSEITSSKSVQDAIDAGYITVEDGEGNPITDVEASAGASSKVGVTSNDTTPSFLKNKLTTATTAVSFTEINDAGDEDLQIDVAVMVGDSGAGGAAGLVPAQIAGDASKFLSGAGTFVTPSAGTDINAKVTTNDTTTGFFNDKITVTAPVTKVVVNPAGNETLDIAVDAATTTTEGVVQLATQGEVDAGTPANSVVTAGTLAATTVTPEAHNHDAGDITTGTFANAQISSSSVTQHVGSIDHDSLLNFVGDEHIDWTTDQGATNIDDGNVPASAVTQHTGSIDHDTLLNFEANEHIDWTADQGGTNINDGNITSSSVTQHAGDIDHDTLTNYVAGEHRVINDAGTSTTELWSADKINSSISAVSAGIDVKDPVETATDAGDGNITLSGEQTINGVLTSTSRVILNDQTDASENGPWVTAAGAWSRPADFDEDAEATNGAEFFVINASSTYYRYKFILTTSDPIVVDTTSLSFAALKPLDFGTTAGTAAEGNDSRIPIQDENDALLGTDGSPSNANRYVTDSDSRLTDSRAPTGSAGGDLTGTYPNPTITNDAVDNAALSDMAANTLKGNNTGSPADPTDLTATQVRSLLNVAEGANNYSHPNHTGDVTSLGDGAQTIAADAVSNTKLANMAAFTLKGNDTGSAADPSDLSIGDVQTLLNIADGATKGVLADDEGSPVAGGPFTTVDFVGSGVVATDGGSGTLTVTVAGGSAPVDSVFGRTGAVVAANGDYDASEVTYTPGLLTDWDGDADPGAVKDALDQLAGRVDDNEISLGSHTHDAGDVTSGTFADARVSSSSVTQHVASIDHDSLLNFIGNEHIDWTLDQGATNIDDNNVPHTSLTNNPHSTDVGNLGSGTLAELNTAITDATLIDTGDSRLSDARTPTGSAGGDLSGTYPNPTIAAGAIGNASLADMSAYTLKLRNAGTTGDPQDVKVTGLTVEASPAAGDFILVELADGSLAYSDIGNLPVGGSSLPVVDSTAIAKGSADATKQVRLEVDGLTTATTRVITVPDQDLTLIDTADSRLSDSRAPNGAAGGGLGGTYPNPTVDGMTSGVLTNDAAHGELGSGTTLNPLHDVATTSSPGFMTADIFALIEDNIGTAWASGLEVTANSPADKKVDVSSGTFYIQGVQYTHSGTVDFDLTADFAALSGGERQIATIYIDATDTVQRVLGTPETGSKKALPGTLPVNSVCLAFVKLDKDKGTAETADITDCRMSVGGVSASADIAVKVSSDDTASGFLDGKLTVSGGIAKAVQNPGADENLDISLTYGTGANEVCQGNDSRLSDARTPTTHATSHTDGSDDIQSATASQKGLATATQITKLDGIETAADVTDATNVAAAGAVMETLADAKGDLFAATAADTVARLPVGGTTGHVLTVDPAESTGMKWAASAGGGSSKVFDVFSPSGDGIYPSAAPQRISRNGHPMWAFDDTVNESIILLGVMGAGYGAGSIDVKIYWAANGVTTGNAKWDAQFERMNTALDLDADSFAAVQTTTTAAPGTDGATVVTTITFTQAQADSIAAGEPYRLKVTADAVDAAHTIAADCQVVRIVVEEQ